MSKTLKTQASNKKAPKKEHQFGFVFTKANLYIMLLGIIFLFSGYLLMAGGKSTDPNVFSDRIFDTQRLVIAPTLLVIGFIIEIVAIMYRPKKTNASNPEETN